MKLILGVLAIALLATPGAAIKPPAYLEFNGTTSFVQVDDSLSIQNLHAASFTVDFWARAHEEWNEDDVIYKSTEHGVIGGWAIFLDVGCVEAFTYYSGRRAFSNTSYDQHMAPNTWNHIAVTFDTATMMNWIAINGEWAAYSLQEAAVGVPVSDAGLPLLFGTSEYYPFDGDLSWVRISAGARYEIGVPFTPPDVATAPAVDAATVELWAMDEGHGPWTRAGVNRANAGRLTDTAWWKW